MTRMNITGLAMLIGSVMLLSATGPSYSQFILQPLNLSVQKVTDIANAGDDRLFIVQQDGLILICDLNGSLYPDPFLDISAQVLFGGERGLLGMAFSPEFETEGHFYVNYTGIDGDNRISRFTLGADPDIADPASEEVLFIIDQPFSNHNGGGMKFGPDGFLYIGSGDGGAAGDPQNNGQDPFSLLGKILRLDVGTDRGYLIPSDNPFYSGTDGDPLIWSTGLRNPWRISFDPIEGHLWIGDVGQNKWEELNRESVLDGGGVNYGWKCFEANAVYDTSGCQAPSFYTAPYYAYDHSGGNCSVTGGFVYRGALHASWYGRYFFTDYCNGVIRSLADSASQVNVFIHGSFSPYSYSTFGEDLYGELYVGKTGNGVFKLTDTTDCKPVAHISYADSIEICGADFKLATPYHPDLNYTWFRNDTVVLQSTTGTYTGNVSGRYKVLVTAQNGCFSVSDDVYVSFHKSIPISIDLQNPYFCQNSSPYVVPVTPDGGVLSGPGVNNGVFVPQVAGVGAHMVHYSYTDSSGCLQEALMTFRVDTCESGVLQNGSWFDLIQNPAQDNLYLTLLRPVSNRTMIRIYDVSGRLVIEREMEEKRSGELVKIRISDLSDGIFVITIGEGSAMEAKKFQKISY
jgi:hypothetical protein